ncbi:NAD(P)(+)--arginine ADP-ribosyltransferase 2-like isoform X1 [Acipenser ruthenus]|uniref:NAD(P)(+)--arginine ADP-ribosyltransferase 2-like isoform X1 n=1 Tax=Acipenser ruthenus TaxID=7906 RepID=UPI0027427534|nr:NAD(P)(+)--arginine ADP-ribosyltransferase 2-like isoform X1 [Acipenser ruthenus]XP_058877764.1 NAD(P)(+)--arginine ADP-ribosyltransferase 2-like isoform X1 [Acipenser ruthenus]XP_058877765.1 NAD(P)(+)--arginine ADP-ribosyltransferase 2-like isoform X1 [Acipenser ruthenus]XP_058877766.1 NAD(P)(+)--arginine ADP-ribosyltransferase 2-like isoform X1 [Acipenser ruthenus]
MNPAALSILLLSAAALLELPQIQCDSAILMDLAEESLDDQYIGCRNEMLKTVQETHLPSELNRNTEFQTAWKRAENEMGQRIQSKLSSEQATAIYVYTINDVYKKFNRAVRTGGMNYTEFPFKAWHFHLTDALKTLKSMKPKCYEVFRGVKNATQVIGNIVRFGQFTSTSVNKTVAERFGTGTLFTIRTCLGVSIKKYSAYSNEKEVLIPPFERFKVMEVNGKEIRLEHIEDHTSYFNCLGGYADKPQMSPAVIAGIVIAVVLAVLSITVYLKRTRCASMEAGPDAASPPPSETVALNERTAARTA